MCSLENLLPLAHILFSWPDGLSSLSEFFWPPSPVGISQFSDCFVAAMERCKKNNTLYTICHARDGKMKSQVYMNHVMRKLAVTCKQ